MQKSIGDRIKELRLEREFSQSDLAKATGLSQGQISRYENGDNSPTSEAIALLAEALKTSADYLVGLTDDPHREINSTSDLYRAEIELLEIYRSKAPDKQSQLIEIAKVV